MHVDMLEPPDFLSERRRRKGVARAQDGHILIDLQGYLRWV
jgi:hypothetical protein